MCAERKSSVSQVIPSANRVLFSQMFLQSRANLRKTDYSSPRNWCLYSFMHVYMRPNIHIPVSTVHTVFQWIPHKFTKCWKPTGEAARTFSPVELISCLSSGRRGYRQVGRLTFAGDCRSCLLSAPAHTDRRRAGAGRTRWKHRMRPV